MSTRAQCGSCRQMVAIPAGSSQFQCGSCGTINQLGLAAPSIPQSGSFSPAAPMASAPMAMAPARMEMTPVYQQPASPTVMVAGGGGAVIVSGPAPQVMDLSAGGLDVLAMFPALLITQRKRNWCFQCCCWDQESHYKISPIGHPNDVLMYATESSSCLCRVCCGPYRELDMKLTAGNRPGGSLIARWYRPLRCRAGSCCCQQEMTAFDHRGSTLGRAMIPFICCCCEGHKLHVRMDGKSASGRDEFFLQGPCCTCGLWPKFAISSNQHIDGEIQKTWGGLHRECCTQADVFQIHFPRDATPAEKASLLGATFLIDYNYYENQQRGNEPCGIRCEQC